MVKPLSSPRVCLSVLIICCVCNFENVEFSFSVWLLIVNSEVHCEVFRDQA